MPFTKEQFLDVFRQYNEAIYPMQAVLYLMAIVAVVLTLQQRRGAMRIAAALWIWCGVVYHGIFFTRINPPAWIFGVLFIAAAAILGKQKPEPVSSVRAAFGGALITYALLLYPLLGMLAGHAYPTMPTFGAPCPLTIFTFGLLLLSARPLRFLPAAVPLVWSLLGLSAVRNFGMIEDAALPVAAAIYVTFLMTEQPFRDVRAALHRAV